jgi:predicted nucleotidyltransferase
MTYQYRSLYSGKQTADSDLDVVIIFSDFTIENISAKQSRLQPF